MLQPIAVGVDGSPESVAAADWAAREALRRGAPLRLVHAWEGLPADDDPVTLPELKVPQYWARRVLRTTRDRLGERYPQVYTSAEQIPEPPVTALLAAAETAQLLVLGHEGLGGVSGVLAGSVARSVVDRALNPVILIRAGYGTQDEHVPDADGQRSEGTPCRHVVVALDLGNDCDALLGFAFEAAQSRSTPLCVLHAWNLHDGVTSLSDGELPVGSPAQREAEWMLAAVLEPWCAKYPTVVVRSRAEAARPGRAVTSAARGAGLLVVGRRIRRGVLGAHSGRVTHLAMHHVRCPVAVVAHD